VRMPSRRFLPLGLQIASDNAPNLCVVSGPEPIIRKFQVQLESKDIVCHLLHTSHAFTRRWSIPSLSRFARPLQRFLSTPAAAFISTVTGLPITAVETTDPAYWARHARSTVQFGNAIRHLKDQGFDLFLECGPRSTMCTLAANSSRQKLLA